MATLKGINVKIGGDVTGLNEALSSVNKNIKGTQSELKEVEKRLKLDPTDTTILAQKQELLKKAIENTSDKLKALKEAEAQVQEQVKKGKVSEEQYRQLQREIFDAEHGLESLEKQAKDTEKALEDAADPQPFEELGDATKKSADKAEKASDGYTVVKDVISDLASNALSSAIDAFKELGIEGEAALDKMQAATGVSAEKMSQYKDTIKDVYSGNYGDSLEDVTTAGKEIVEVLGEIDNADFNGVLKNSLALRDIYDMDIKEQLRAVNSLTDQFGITSQQAYNLIVQGAQKGLNQNDDLLDTINEYSVQFKTAGYSADEMFNMLANGTESGTWSVDKLGDAVKEFTIRMTDGTANEALESIGLNADSITAKFAQGGESAKSATQEIIGKLASMTDKQEQYIAGQAIFGTMWEDLGAEAVGSLMDTEGAINSTNEAMSQADTTAYDNANASFETLKRTVAVDVSEALTGLLELLSPVFEWLTENEWAINVLVIAIGALAAGMAAYTVAQLVANAAMWACPITWIVAAIAALIAIIVLVIKNWDALSSACSSAWHKICDAVGNAWDWIKQKCKDGVNVVIGVLNGIIGGAEWIVNKVIGAVNWGIQKINGLLGGISDVLAYVGLDVNFQIPSVSEISIPRIPLLAKGGDVLKGSAIVGEAGPELLTVNAGKTTVQPLTNSERANPVSGAQYNVSFNIETLNNLDSSSTAEDLVNMTMERIEFMTQRKGAAVGA